jgi:hypothetical protein
MTKFSISNVKVLTSIFSHGWMDFRVKEPAPCVAPAQIGRDFVPMGNERTLGFSVVVKKRAPISRRRNVPPYGWRKLRRNRNWCCLWTQWLFLWVQEFSDRKTYLIYGGWTDHEGKVSGFFTVVRCILILSKFLHQQMHNFLIGVLKLYYNNSNIFRCNHHHQGAHYLSLLKLHLVKQPIKIHWCG